MKELFFWGALGALVHRFAHFVGWNAVEVVSVFDRGKTVVFARCKRCGEVQS